MNPRPGCQTRITSMFCAFRETAFSTGETPASKDVLAALIDEKPAQFRKGGVLSTAHEFCLLSPRKHTPEVASLLSRLLWVKNRVSFKKPARFGICRAPGGAVGKRIQPGLQRCQLVRVSSMMRAGLSGYKYRSNASITF
jgi:hypothetical protein